MRGGLLDTAVEPEVAELEAFGATVAGDFQVFAGAHGKEKRAYQELAGGDILVGDSSCDNLAEETGSESFLLVGRGV